jgi:alkaline phosphatase D
MARLTRRGFLLTSTGTAACVAFGNLGCPADPPRFRHGVASGDPLSDRVILWTRVTVPGSPSAVGVTWRIALDPLMIQVVQNGSTFAVPASDYTVKLDVTGLTPDTAYYFQFRSGDWASPVGRTRTFPDANDTEVEKARFALISCINYQNGFFNGCGGIARRDDLAAVICIGDYYYEGGNGLEGDGTSINRIPDPNLECTTLAHYRTRHAQYKADPTLQEMHRQHPFISIWDDHEYANDAWRFGAENHTEGPEGLWVDRLAASLQAYYEWMPIRQVDPGDPLRIFRSVSYGKLLDLTLIDARLFGRDEQALSGSDSATICDASRDLIGPTQESFVATALGSSLSRGATWRLLGNQVILSPLLNVNPLDTDFVANTDQWDGYEPGRQRLLDILEDYNGNIIVMTGDVHTSWALRVQRDPANVQPCGITPASPTQSLAVEFVGPAISSSGVDQALWASLGASFLMSSQPHLEWVELASNGYVILDVTPARVQADYWFTPSRRIPSNAETWSKGFQVATGSNDPVEVFSPSMACHPAQPAPDSLVARWLREESDVRLDVG